MKRKIGLDVGDVRIGVAVSDLLGICANPRETYVRSGDAAKDAEYFTEYAKREEADAFVMGLPKNDERLTTVSAERLLIEADVRRDKRKKVIDKVAATIILQSYLDGRGGLGV